MSATHDAPGDWSTLLPHEAGRRITAIEPFAGQLVVHEWRHAQPQVRVVRRDGPDAVLDFGTEPHDLELGANPEWDTSTLRLSYQSLTTPHSVYDEDLATGVRTLRKQTPTPNVDLAAYTSTRRVGDRRRRHTRARRHRASRRHPARRHGARRDLRLRVLRVVARAVVQRRPAVIARPRRGVGAGPPARWRRARPLVVPRRQAAAQAQHVHRHDRRRRPPRRARCRRRGPAGHPRRPAPGACWWGRA